MPRRPEMTRDSAETVAIQALSFIAEEPERLDRFLALTGIGPDSLRDATREPNFLLGVLDHLAGDDRLLLEFATQKDIAPEVVTAARDLLARAPPATP
jgi:Protein of unknown function (DUF3572)